MKTKMYRVTLKVLMQGSEEFVCGANGAFFTKEEAGSFIITQTQIASIQRGVSVGGVMAVVSIVEDER